MSVTESSVMDPSEQVVANGVHEDASRSVERHSRSRNSATFLRSVVRVLLFVVGATCVTWPLVDPLFRNKENDLMGLVCLPISIGAAAIFVGIAIGSTWKRAVIWFSIAMVGQAVSLQLIDAGWQLRYQHYRTIPNIFESSLDTGLFVFLVVQSLVVITFLIPRISEIGSWVSENFRPWQMVLIGLTFFLSTTIVSKDLWILAKEWIFAVFVQLTFLSTILAGALSIPNAEKLGSLMRLVDRLQTIGSRTIGSFPVAVIGLATFAFATSAALSILSYERHPHVPDEVAYLIHAKIFASGSLTMAAPAVPEAFETFLIASTGDRWYPSTPPGWPIVLAIGEVVGLAWIVNPLLAGCNIFLSFSGLRRLFSPRVTYIATILLAVSPWYLFLGMSYMTHMFSLTCVLVTLISVIETMRTGSARWALLCGSGIGLLSLVRPLEAVSVGLVTGLWMLAIKNKAITRTVIAGLIVGLLIFGGLGLAYNTFFTGHPLRFPVNEYFDKEFGVGSNSLGFGSDRGVGWALDPNPGHSPLDSLINSSLNITSINTELFGWGMGSLLIVSIGLFWKRLAAADFFLLSLTMMIYFAHFFYWFSGGPDFGARYWFLMIFPLTVLAARGIEKIIEQSESFNAQSAVYVTFSFLCVASLVTFIPWRAIDKYQNFRGMKADIRYMTGEDKFGRGLVMIRGNLHPDFDSAMVYNSVEPSQDRPIYALAVDQDVALRLLLEYGDRPVWVLDGPSLSGTGFRIVAGPSDAIHIRNKIEQLF